jgi:SNF2 family DNA or RNA helicase
VIVWAKFLREIDDMVHAMRERTDAARVATIVGGMTGDERIRLRDDFQDGKYDFLIGNAQSGGLGLTLTRSHFTIYYSNTQSGEDRLQSEDRTHRHGQDEPCVYVDMIAKKTVDVPIYASMLEKKDLDVYVREKIRMAGGQPTNQAIMDYLEEVMGEI